MTKKTPERGICELYQDDPERADAQIWGRKTEAESRRGFLKMGGLAAMAMAVGAAIPFARNMPGGLIPAAHAETTEPFMILGKEGLVVLGDRPINAETPAHFLDDDITPTSRHFVRNNGLISPMAEKMDANGWILTIDGEVHKPLQLTLDDLKKRFKHYTYTLQLECGGNGRAGFNPPAKGNQWTIGAIGCATYTGVRLADVLKAAELKDSAVYTGYYGSDVHLSGDPEKVVISRGTPIHKAVDPHTLIVWEMNGEPLPAMHGFPVRIVTPGWAGSTSPKWLRRIWVRDKEHDGPKMTGHSYRVPKYPVEPGVNVPESDMKIIESLPVKSVITSPATGAKVALGSKLHLRGAAWAGDNSVKQMDLSFDFGVTWVKAKLHRPVNPFAWQRWEADLQLPIAGYYEVWARATDDKGRMQPMVVPGWNPQGYLNNAMHRIAVYVA